MVTPAAYGVFLIVQRLRAHANWLERAGYSMSVEDVRRAADLLEREPDNHHNALRCPYCNPKGLVLREAD